MKTKYLFSILMLVLITSCKNRNNNYTATGIFEATEIIVSSKNTGEIIQFNLEEGQELLRGAHVGCIDTTQLYLKKEQLRSNQKSIQNRMTNTGRQVAALKEQISKQKTEKKRYETMLASNAATQKQVDDINSQLLVLEKQLSAQLETLDNNNRSLSDESSSIGLQIAQIDDEIGNAIIKSPIDGTVLTKYAEPGEFATPGRSLFKIADIRHMNLRVYITADQLTEMELGQKVRVFADSGKENNREYPGTIIWISDKAEFTPKTIQTRDERANLVYAVKVAVENDKLIKKGMYGEIKLQ